MGKQGRSNLRRYGLAVLLTALALGARFALTDLVGPRSPVSTFFLAVVLSAWVGGWGPGVLATVLGTIGAIWFMATAGTWDGGSAATLLSLGLFVLVGLITSATGGARLRETRRAEATADALRLSESRLAAIIASAMDAVITVDADLRVVVFNTAAERMFGVAAGDAIGGPLDRFIPPRFREGHGEHIRRFGRTGVTARSIAAPGELIGLRADGGEFPIEVTISQAAANGQRIYTAIIRDVGDRRRTDEQIRLLNRDLGRSVRELQTLFDVLPVGVAVAQDPQCRDIRMNPAGARMLGIGVTENASKGRPDADSLPFKVFRDGREVPADELPMQRAAAEGVTLRDAELELVYADGRTATLFEYASPLFDEGGKVRGVLGVFVDITERKRHEAELREVNETLERRVAERTAALEERARELAESQRAVRDSEERFRQMAQVIPEVFWVASRDFDRIDYLSPAFAEVFGRSPEVMYADPRAWLSFVHPDDLPRVRGELDEWLKHSEHRLTMEYRVLRPDGAVRWVRNRVFPIRDERGRVFRRAGVAEDITLQREAEEQIDAYHARLRALASDLTLSEERERRTIAEGMHDHLGQLLATVKLMFGGLRVHFAQEKAKGLLDRADDLLAQAIQFTRTLTFELSPPVLYELGLVPAISWLCGQMGQQHRLQVECDADDGPDPREEDVRVLLFQAVREVLFNVVKHARAESARVTVRHADGRIAITIEDRGRGFDPAGLAADPGRAAGFGLFNIRERLDLVGGKMMMESAPGQGTRVTLIAPLGPDAAKGR